ncbi:hypothetical protein BGX24_002765 [Mortierella sp. AD032]|nr:hypothetical protein BGX24_002765 [Mortierella sp. AD032]
MRNTTFSDLPYEVQEHIAFFLDQRNLNVCLRVCQTWRTLLIPILWTHPTIKWHYKSTETSLPAALKANGHHVRSLRLKCTHGCDPQFTWACPSSFPLLDSLEVNGSGHGGWSYLPFFATLFPAGWKKLVYRLRGYADSNYVFGCEFFKGIVSHSSTLQVLRLEAGSISHGPGIHQLMCLAANLRELYISNDRQHSEGYLDAQAIVGTEWICDNLEVFVCRIRKIPRPDITRHINGSPGNAQLSRSSSITLEESIVLQRRVYAKLARFKRLRELRLGFPVNSRVSHFRHRRGDKEVYRQYDCLAMTLESGLDLLKDLKELRTVGLQDMEIYIDGDKEQTWFAEYWPFATIGYEDYHTDSDATSVSSDSNFEEDSDSEGDDSDTKGDETDMEGDGGDSDEGVSDQVDNKNE